MSGHIIEIPQTKGMASIWEQRLKVAAYAASARIMKTGRRVWKTKSPYTPDFLTGKQIRNQEDLDKYFIEDAHEAIIDKESFEKVQARKKHAAK